MLRAGLRAALLCAAPALLPAADAPPKPTPPPTAAAALAPEPAIDLRNMDRTAKAADDFNRFANGGWLDRNPVPADLVSWGAFDELRERNNAILRDIAAAAATKKDAAADTPDRKIGDFYASGMDEAALNAAGAKPLADEFAKIDAIADKAGLAAAFGRLRQIGADVGFGFFGAQDAKDSTQVIGQFTQAGLGLPDRDYYIKDDPDSVKTRARYLAHVARMFALLGDKSELAADRAKRVMALETILAKGSLTRVQRRDREANYNKMTVAETQALMPEFPLDKFLAEAQPPALGSVNVGQPGFLKAFNQLLQEAPLEDWKAYARWHLLKAAAPYLSNPFVQADWEFYGRDLTGAKEPRPRWKRVVETMDGGIGELLGQAYVAKAFPPEAKQRVLAMVENLRAALRRAHRAARLDDPRHQGGGAEEARRLRRQDGLPRPVARLLQALHRPRRLRLERLPRPPARVPPRRRPHRPARGPQGMGHDPAHGERLLPLLAERDRLPRRHSPAAPSLMRMPTTP